MRWLRGRTAVTTRVRVPGFREDESAAFRNGARRRAHRTRENPGHYQWTLLQALSKEPWAGRFQPLPSRSASLRYLQIPPLFASAVDVDGRAVAGQWQRAVNGSALPRRRP